ncbi:O-antigen ligase [Brevundimonas sp. LM2]|uniref:O-antigen ligase family protein n=1 Tax=Brevundimonas sp. LM2 TaxID=1938605 RepID=UPI0012379788|nr:hypothetical protein [Brevundimonas sp. LM2]
MALLVLVVPLIVFGANNALLATVAATLQALVAVIVVLCARDIVPAFWARLSPAAVLFALMLLAGVLFILGIGGPTSPFGRASALVELVKLAGCGGVFLTFAILATERGRLRSIIALMAIFGGGYALVSLWLFQEDPSHVFGVAKGLRVERFTGTLMNANVAGCVFGVFALLTFGWLQALVVQRRWSLGAFAGLILVLCLAALTRTQSRTAFALTFILVLVLLGSWLLRNTPSQRFGRFAIAGLVVISLGIVAVAAGGPLLSRFGLLQADWNTRMMSFSIYSAVAADAPAWGFGMGTFSRIHAMLLLPGNATLLWDLNAAHSAPVQFLLEAGPVMSVLFGGALAYLVTFVISSRARPTGLQFAAAVASIVLIVGCSLVDIALNVPAVAALAAALGGLVFGACAAPYALQSQSARSQA